MANHATLDFSTLHKAVFDSGLAVDRPLAPEGGGDAYWAQDTEVLYVSDGADIPSWISYTLSDIGSISSNNLNDLNDVTITSVVDNQILQYNSGTGEWENVTLASIPSSLNDLSDVTLSGSEAKGSLLVNNNSVFVNVAVGSNGQVLVADSAQSAGVAWQTFTSAVDEDAQLLAWLGLQSGII